MTFNTHIPSDGRVLVRCERKPRGGLPHCGQRAYVLGIDAGVCAVVPVSMEEWAALAAGQDGAIAVLRMLGVLTEPVRLEAVA